MPDKHIASIASIYAISLVLGIFIVLIASRNSITGFATLQTTKPAWLIGAAAVWILLIIVWNKLRK